VVGGVTQAGRQAGTWCVSERAGFPLPVATAGRWVGAPFNAAGRAGSIEQCRPFVRVAHTHVHARTSISARQPVHCNSNGHSHECSSPTSSRAIAIARGHRSTGQFEFPKHLGSCANAAQRGPAHSRKDRPSSAGSWRVLLLRFVQQRAPFGAGNDECDFVNVAPFSPFAPPPPPHLRATHTFAPQNQTPNFFLTYS